MNRALALFGFALVAIGLVWSTARVLIDVGWRHYLEFFGKDPPFMLIVVGALIAIVGLLFL